MTTIVRMSAAEMLAEVHAKTGRTYPTTPTALAPDEAEYWLKCLLSEVNELTDAMKEQDIVGTAGELADVAYLIYAIAQATGVDLDAVLAEVHRANMTKTFVDENGRLCKPVKGAGFMPADIATALDLAGSK